MIGSAVQDLKYRSAFPARFSSIEAARIHCRGFFRSYDDDHRHGSLCLHTAADVHHGQAPVVRAAPAKVDAAYTATPSAFRSRATLRVRTAPTV